MPQIDTYLQFMVEEGASDLHLSSGERLTLRIDGVMVETTEDSSNPLTHNTVMQMLMEIMPDRNRQEFEQHSDTDFAYELADIGRFRVNAFMDHKGIGAVFRHIPQQIMTFEELGLPDILQKFCYLQKGLILVTGPTGSGKSTTLAAMVDYINRNRNGHIITIEDPIEFVYENHACLINQREVHRHTTSFKTALRAALREDPDIILVGEMRDLETTEMAIETAETGHLVLGTLHTSTERQGQIRSMLANSLKGIVCQTLLRRKSGKGRIAALEILVTTTGISNNIREGKTHQIPNAIQTGGSYGMQSLNNHLLQLVNEGLIEPRDAYRQSVEKQQMGAKLRAAGYDIS